MHSMSDILLALYTLIPVTCDERNNIFRYIIFGNNNN